MSTLRGVMPLCSDTTHPSSCMAQGRAVAFGQQAGLGIDTFASATPSNLRPRAGSLGVNNRFIFGGLELIPCAALILLGAAAFYARKLFVVTELPLKLGYNIGVRKILGHFIPSLRALPKWGWLDLVPDFTKHL